MENQAERWITDLDKGSYGITIRVDREILQTHTGIQRLEIIENSILGRILLLDGRIMLTERDEFTYHEMMAHPGLLAHPNPCRVLIIGGGDGGTLREVLKHPEIEEVVLCEIDPGVIEASRQYLPFVAGGFDSPKAQIHIGDGSRYVSEHPQSFDVVIVDCTDPEGLAEGLFQGPFYSGCKKALRHNGVFVQQSESPFFDFDNWKRIYAELASVFGRVFPYGASVPMYLSGFWTFAFASDSLSPWDHFGADRAERLAGLRYYTPELQKDAFSLPLFARNALKTRFSRASSSVGVASCHDHRG